MLQCKTAPCPPPTPPVPYHLSLIHDKNVGNPDGLHKLKEQESPHLIAGLIVWHLKRQSEPLVPYSLYPLVVAAGTGAAEAAEAAARRAQYPGDDGQEEEDADDEDDDEDRDVDEDDEELDEEADRGGRRGLSGGAPGSADTGEAEAQAGVGEGGGAKGGGGGSGTAVAKALAVVASVAKKSGFLTGELWGARRWDVYSCSKFCRLFFFVIVLSALLCSGAFLFGLIFVYCRITNIFYFVTAFAAPDGMCIVQWHFTTLDTFVTDYCW